MFNNLVNAYSIPVHVDILDPSLGSSLVATFSPTHIAEIDLKH